MQTKSSMGNCPVGTWYLISRISHVDRVAAIHLDGTGDLCPYHLIAMTQKGHVLHFRSRQRSLLQTFWFPGKFSVHTQEKASVVFQPRIAFQSRLGRFKRIRYLAFLSAFLTINIATATCKIVTSPFRSLTG